MDATGPDDGARGEELARLVATAKRFSASLDHETVLAAIVEDATTLLDASSGDILLWDRERGTLRVVAVWGLPADLLGHELRFGEGVSSAAISEGRPIEVDDYAMYPGRARSLDRYRFGSVLCAPLLFRGDAIGAINVHTSDSGRRFAPGDADLLQAFAGLAAIAIDHARRFENEVRLRSELARSNADLVRSLSLQHRLSAQVLAGGGPSALAAELANVLDRPVVIEDHLDRPLAGASPDGGGGWRDLVGANRSTATPATRRRRPTSGPVADVVRVPVTVGSELVGRLALGAHDEPGPLDRALADIAVTGVALEFAKIRAAHDVEQRIRGDVIADLLTGSYSSVDVIHGRAARLGYRLDDLRDVLVVAIEQADRVGDADTDDAAVRLERRIVDRLGDMLAIAAPGSAVAAVSRQVVVLAAARRDPDLGSPVTLGARIRAVITGLEPGVGVSVAIGDDCHGVDDLGEAYRLAREALALMARLGRMDQVIDARALGPYRVLLSATDPVELRTFARRTLEPVLELDRRTGSELLATLRAYLAAAGVRRRAAADLVVHVNTVVYRLDRIERALGRSLDDPDTRFDLTLALRILDVFDEDPASPGRVSAPRRPASREPRHSRTTPASRGR